jgi:hypothetical protein
MLTRYLTTATVLLATSTPLYAKANVTTTGLVLDARTNQPLSNVFIEQENSTNSAFTTKDGRFSLKLDDKAPQTLIFHLLGYDTLTAPIKTGSVIRLEPIRGVSFDQPSQTNRDTDRLTKQNNEPLFTSLMLNYRTRYQDLSDGQANINGWANNDWMMRGRIRLGQWLLEPEVSHNEIPVNVAGLSRAQNPAFNTSSWFFMGRAGYILPLGFDRFNLAINGYYRYMSYVPNNGDVLFTGSNLDFRQGRHAFGPQLLASWSPLPQWRLEGNLAYFPAVIATSDLKGQTFAKDNLLEARVFGEYEFIKGLAVGLSYSFENASGVGFDRSNLLGIYLNYRPTSPSSVDSGANNP